MKRFLLPVLGILAALWAAYSVARTAPRRTRTSPPAPAPISDYPRTVAAVGLVEANSENIAIGTPLAGVVTRIFVTVGQAVNEGEPLFALDTRQLRADAGVRRTSLAIAKSGVKVARARLDDAQRNLDFAEGLADKRAISAERRRRGGSHVRTAKSHRA